jgi:predicted XRE-type DNA-binding protein
MSNSYIGSDFDDFLDQEGILDEVEALAIKKVIASMVEQAMGEAHITKTEMARRMGTSRSQLDRLLDPTCASITVDDRH